jgi:pimeloyl-ACP methyl ester carboxylesterase
MRGVLCFRANNLMRLAQSIFFLLLFACSVHGQSVLPDQRHMRLEYEDERLRVIRLTLAPGEATPMLDLNERITTSVNDGHLRITFAGSEPQQTDSRAGATAHEMSARVSYQNAGTTEWQCVITEFKGQFAKNATPTRASDQMQEVANRPPPSTPAPAAVTPANPPTQRRPSETIPIQEPQTEVQPARSAEHPQPQPQPPPAEPTSLNVEGAKMLFVNGTELAYIERGQGPVVVLVHDTLGDYRSWAPQLAALAKSYRVIAYSRRYHYPNHSNGKEHDYTYDGNAKDLAEFIRALNAGAVRLVGFGYGASIAGMVAAEHPELVKALVLTEPAYEQLLDTTSAFRSRFAREEIYGIIRKPLTKDKPERGVQVYVDWLGYQSWAGMSQEEQYRKKQNSNALHAQTLDAVPPNFACATGKKITAPTLILSGQRRSPNSAEIAGVLSACIPNAERATVSNSGAAVYMDNPAEANKVLMEFLAKH